MKATKRSKRSKIVFDDPDDVSFETPKLSAEEREEAYAALREHRKAHETKRTPEAKLKTDLLQLRFLMEDYIQSDEFNEEMGFGYFLKEYIERIRKKSNEFADEINVNPSEISQFIHKHREPSSKFFIRLEIHSNKIFPALMWHKILSKEKALELLNYGLRGDEEKQVKKRLSLSF
jgi:hypothetical protein